MLRSDLHQAYRAEVRSVVRQGQGFPADATGIFPFLAVWPETGKKLLLAGLVAVAAGGEDGL